MIKSEDDEAGVGRRSVGLSASEVEEQGRKSEKKGRGEKCLIGECGHCLIRESPENEMSVARPSASRLLLSTVQRAVVR